MSGRKKNQLSRFCRIYHWIEQEDPELAAAIRNLCMERNLTPHPKSTGVTFLYPKEASVREEIIKLAYSDEADQAIKKIESLILPMLVATVADFRGEVGSRLGVKFEVDKITGGKVTLKNEAVISIAPNFKPLKRDNIAVWIIESGVAPLDGPAFKTPRKGGAEPRMHNSSLQAPLSARAQLAANVEGEFDRCMHNNRCRTNNPYLSKTVSLLTFLSQHHGDLLQCVLPLIDRDPAVSFYLLLEPYKTQKNDFLIPTSILFGADGWNGAEAYEDAVAEFKHFFDTIPKQTALTSTNMDRGGPAIPKAFSEPSAVRSMVDIVRQRVLTGTTTSINTTPQILHKTYASLGENNSIDGFGPIFPDATIVATRNGKKLWQDEFRFVLHGMLRELMDEQIYTTQTFSNVVHMLRFGRPGDNYAEEAIFSNLVAYQPGNGDVAPADRFKMLITFINSTDFLYAAIPEAFVGDIWVEKRVGGAENADSLLNHDHSKLQVLNRSNPMVRSGLPAECRFQLRHYIARHGSLPPDIGISAN